MSGNRLLLTGARFWGAPDAEALVVRGDRIAALVPRGASDEWASLERVDLSGLTVLPGFIDAHVHVLHTGLAETGWSVSLGGMTRQEALDRLHQVASERTDGQWIQASGWDESTWTDRRMLDRAALDRAVPDHPLIAIRVDGHLLAANSPAIERLPTGIPEHLVDRNAGHVREEAIHYVKQRVQPGLEQQIEAVAGAARRFHAEGITSVHTMTPPKRFPALRQACHAVSLRVAAYASSLAPWECIDQLAPQDDPWFRVVGWKTFADGSIGARNAAMSVAYADGGCGALNHADDDLRAWIRHAGHDDWATAVHAIGDRAIAQVLDAHQAAGSPASLPHRIEHFEFPAKAQIQRAVGDGIALCMQPNFVGNWSGPGGLYEEAIGEVRDRKGNPLRALVDAGALLAFGSDGMPVSARYGIHSTVHAPASGQRLAVDEAVAAYTETPARLVGESSDKGRLAEGLLADLVVLREDPRHADRIDEIDVVATMVGGRFVHGARNVGCNM